MPQKFYCKYCGMQFPSVTNLTVASCIRYPAGANKGKHSLYEGSEKSSYTCKHCGQKFTNLSQLTVSTCIRHPSGVHKGKHEPAL